MLAPVAGDQAESTLVAIGQRLSPVLRSQSGWVVADGGRWSPSQATASRLTGCDLVAVVVSPSLASVAHARSIVPAIHERLGSDVVSVVVGERGYRPDEVAGVLGVPVVGSVPWEPRWVESLVTTGVSRLWQRSTLARSVRSLADQFAGLAVGGG